MTVRNLIFGCMVVVVCLPAYSQQSPTAEMITLVMPPNQTSFDSAVRTCTAAGEITVDTTGNWPSLWKLIGMAVSITGELSAPDSIRRICTYYLDHHSHLVGPPNLHAFLWALMINGEKWERRSDGKLIHTRLQKGGGADPIYHDWGILHPAQGVQ